MLVRYTGVCCCIIAIKCSPRLVLAIRGTLAWCAGQQTEVFWKIYSDNCIVTYLDLDNMLIANRTSYCRCNCHERIADSRHCTQSECIKQLYTTTTTITLRTGCCVAFNNGSPCGHRSEYVCVDTIVYSIACRFDSNVSVLFGIGAIYNIIIVSILTPYHHVEHTH